MAMRGGRGGMRGRGGPMVGGGFGGGYGNQGWGGQGGYGGDGWGDGGAQWGGGYGQGQNGGYGGGYGGPQGYGGGKSSKLAQFTIRKRINLLISHQSNTIFHLFYLNRIWCSKSRIQWWICFGGWRSNERRKCRSWRRI